MSSPFYEALLVDLIGAPEFLAGVYLARLYLRTVPFAKGSLPRLVLSAGLFVLTAFAGTGLRYALFAEPAPGFISFGFGVTVAAELGVR